jgi:hypothetical protein
MRNYDRAVVAAAYWLDASPHERTEEDGLILARAVRDLLDERAALDEVIIDLTKKWTKTEAERTKYKQYLEECLCGKVKNAVEDKIKQLEIKLALMKERAEKAESGVRARLMTKRACKAEAELETMTNRAVLLENELDETKAELAEVERVKTRWLNKSYHLEERLKDEQYKRKKSEANLDRLREALGWYAPRLWKFGHLYSSTDKKKVFEELAHDSGKRARDALAGTHTEKESH